MACVTLVFEYWWYKYRKATPKITAVAESTTIHNSGFESKDTDGFRSKETADKFEGKNTLLRTRITNQSKKTEPKF